MMEDREYIDREDALDALLYALAGTGYQNRAMSAIKCLPAADVVEAVHGHWIEHDDDWCGTFYTCSACGCDWTTIDGTPQENHMRYCPECGANMDGERRMI